MISLQFWDADIVQAAKFSKESVKKSALKEGLYLKSKELF